MEKLSLDKRINIYARGIENELFYRQLYYRDSIKKYNAGLILFLFLGIILSKPVALKKKKIVWINGDRGYEKYYDIEKMLIIHHGRFFKRITNFSRYPSIFSFFSFQDRMKILIEGINNWRKIKTGNIFYWLEFCFIYKILERNEIDTVYTPHISDRQITWISYILKGYNSTLEISQHGIVTYLDTIPNKIFCSHFLALSVEQIKICRLNIIDNLNSCVFKVKEYKSLINFDFLKKEKKIYIGIASQCNPDFINQFVYYLNESPLIKEGNAEIILMLHPMDQRALYEKSKFLKIEDKIKFFNIDVLVTVNSTIIYDYYYSGYRDLILQVDKDDFIGIFREFKNVKLFRQIQEAVDYLNCFYLLDGDKTNVYNKFFK